jgi:hypothetical protein
MQCLPTLHSPKVELPRPNIALLIAVYCAPLQLQSAHLPPRPFDNPSMLWQNDIERHAPVNVPVLPLSATS